MLGQINSQVRKVTVIGGGISGLLIAYVLDQKGYEVSLFESENRMGGVIRTQINLLGISESAAHSLLVTPKIQKFFEDLGVSLLQVQQDSKARYLMRQGKMRKFPLTICEAFRAFFRAYFVLASQNSHSQEMSLAEWAEKFLGQPVLQYLITPMVKVIYAAHPNEINVSAAFPGLVIPQGHSLLSYQIAKWVREKMKRKGKVKRPQMMAPAEGMGSFVNALEKKLREKLGSRIYVGTPVTQLTSKNSEENVILAVPAYSAAKLLKEEDRSLAEALDQVRYVSIASVTVFLNYADLREVPKATGMVLSEEEGPCLGILFNSSAFENRVSSPNILSCTVMLGGSQYPSAFEYSDDAMIQIVEQMLKRVLGLKSGLAGYQIHRWQKAIPLYNSELKRTWQIAKQGWCSRPGHVLFGNYTGKVGLRGLIETVLDSEVIPSFKKPF